MESVAAVLVLVLLNSILNGLVGVTAQVKFGTILQGCVTTMVLQISLTHGAVPGGVNFLTLKQTV